MKHRNTNKHIFTAIFALALIVACCACIVSCGGDNEETLYPEYTGDIWTYDVDSHDHHDTVDIDNVIAFESFEKDTNSQNEIVITNAVATDAVMTDDSSSTPVEDGDTAEITHSHDHMFPEDEFDPSGYQTLKPVTTRVKD